MNGKFVYRFVTSFRDNDGITSKSDARDLNPQGHIDTGFTARPATNYGLPSDCLQIKNKIWRKTMICTKCGVDKSPEEFNWKIKAKGRRATRCKLCHKTYRDQHYQDNKEKRIRQAKARCQNWIEENRLFIIQYLQSHPCVDCGENDILVLELDHKEPRSNNPKSKLVPNLLRHSRERLIEEIEKCEVRCCNCHRRRTAIQTNSYRLRFV